MNRARSKAAAEGRTLTSLIEDGLRLVTSEFRRPSEPKRIELPVSQASGGFRPGMEHLTFSQLQELDDLDYVERMKRFK